MASPFPWNADEAQHTERPSVSSSKTGFVITLAASPAIQPRAERLVESIVERWPGRAPKVRSITLDALLAGLRPWDDGGRFGAGEALVVAIGNDEPSLRSFHLRDALVGALAPALVLHEDPDAPELRDASGPVVMRSLDLAASEAAAIVHTLATRQHAVETVRTQWQIAAHLQSGMHNDVDRLHEELTLAATVQREWMPREMPTAEGFEFDVLFRPAGYVSGDIYDVYDQGGGRVGFYVADAMGHGVPAALMTLMIARSLRSHEKGESPLPPETALKRLNRELLQGNKGRARFATAICGTLDTTTGRARLACAGHPPPVIAGGGSLRPVQVDGPLLGVFAEVEYEPVEVTLAAGQTLLLYSDGFELAFGGGEKHAEQPAMHGFFEQIQKLRWPADGQPWRLVATFEELARALDAQVGSLHQTDDLTAVGICSRRAVDEKRLLVAA